MSKPKVCSIEGCYKPVHGHGWCKKHCRRWKTHGDPLTNKNPNNGKLLPFLKKVIKSNINECVEWPFVISSSGYGQVTFEGREQTAHRVALILHTGKDPEGMYACHTCHNRACVNPHHLYWGTQSQNMMDRVKDGTSIRGEQCYNSKLTEDQVRAIRKDIRSPREIAKDYPISRGAIYHIRRGTTWSWLD